MQNARTELAAAIRESQGVLLVGTVPVLVALGVAAEPLVRLLLGEAWLPTAPLVLWLALGALILFRRLPLIVALNAIGSSRWNFAATATESVLSAAALLALAPFGLPAMAAVRGCASVVGWLVVTRRVAMELGLPSRREAAGLSLDLALVTTVLVLVRQLEPAMAAEPLIIQLGLQAGVGFAATLALLIASRPWLARLIGARLRRRGGFA